MVAYTYRINAGVPGHNSRPDQAKIESLVIDSSTPPLRYGEPVKLVSGKVQPVAASDVASVVYGFLVRPFVTQASTDPLGTSTPPTSGVGDVMVSGYINALVRAGTAAANGAVYVRVANATSTKPIGGVEAAADGGNCVAITGAIFMGAADSNGNVEIRYNI